MVAKIEQDATQTLLNICKCMSEHGIDYRVTGLTAANLYGYGLGTNVLDIAVGSDSEVCKAVSVLGLPRLFFTSYDPYVYRIKKFGGYIRMQGDVMGEPTVHPLGIKLHSKEFLIDRLDIYEGIERKGRIAQATAFIALTLDDEKVEKYRDIWNRL